jgi:hypothetical protein
MNAAFFRAPAETELDRAMQAVKGLRSCQAADGVLGKFNESLLS